ncbi:hypothetical protein [Desmospora profundinema]|uniref:Uncharacterized protein n=1 Tax=Desmospora profundinema TaxID=1571184 RepID=A0ABU1IQP5_9BACL|nr:hypothetical protein [Desmospora profundinema]MDR6227048.1 hypothetical protein [Desmospora profundinema]
MKQLWIWALILVTMVGCGGQEVVPEKEGSEGSPQTEASSGETEEKPMDEGAAIPPFELTTEMVDALKKGEIPGLPIDFGATETAVIDTLGEPQKREEDEPSGHVELVYEHATVDLSYYQSGSQTKLDEPIVSGILFHIGLKKDEIKRVLGEPTDERAVAPGYPELEYIPGPFLLLFLTETEREFEGPYDKVLVIEQ